MKEHIRRTKKGFSVENRQQKPQKGVNTQGKYTVKFSGSFLN